MLWVVLLVVGSAHARCPCSGNYTWRPTHKFFTTYEFSDLYNCRSSFLDAVPSCVPPDAKGLMLANNNIPRLGHDFFKGGHTNLHVLELYNCNLKTVAADTFHLLPNLTFLDLRRNKLMALNFDQFKFNSQLEIVWLPHNPSLFIFASSEPMEKLTTLAINSCSMESLIKEQIGRFPNLLWLDAGNNKVVSLRNDSFVHAPKLKVLLLYGNQIGFLPPEFLAANPNLEFLDLSNNYLTYLPGNLLDNINQLQFLNISNNKLQILDPRLFRLKTDQLSMLGNSWLWNCDSAQFMYEMHALNVLKCSMIKSPIAIKTNCTVKRNTDECHQETTVAEGTASTIMETSPHTFPDNSNPFTVFQDFTDESAPTTATRTDQLPASSSPMTACSCHAAGWISVIVVTILVSVAANGFLLMLYLRHKRQCYPKNIGESIISEDSCTSAENFYSDIAYKDVRKRDTDF